MITSVVFDSKMFVKMISVMVRLDIAVETILTLIPLIVMNTHVSVQQELSRKCGMTIRFQTFVPKIVFGSFLVNLTMAIQIILNI